MPDLVRTLPALTRLVAALALCPLAATAQPPAGGALPLSDGAEIALTMDFARVFPLAAEIGTVVLGNPEIADATVTNGNTMVLTGRGVGTTNVIALGENGQTLSENTVVVAARKPGTVTVRRAQEVASYSCASGLCEFAGGSEGTRAEDSVIR